MAHYKRGRCRYQGPTRRDSEVHMRTRLGLKPVRIPHRWGAAPADRLEWSRWYDSMRRVFWPANKMWKWSRNDPRSHDILHHNRPRRQAERRLARAVMMERVDMDEALWPLDGKPRIWYW